MIHLSPEARLSIILPNTNKALSEAIKNATPEQLETLKEGKDIKSLLTSVFQDKTTASKSDQTLLDLLKNSTAFKTRGNFSDSLQSLIHDLKISPDTAMKTAVLENFLKNITALDSQSLKNQIANSGVFMESKLAAALQKLPDLIQSLEQLKTALAKNPAHEAKTLLTYTTSLLENPILSKASDHPESAARLADALKKATDLLQTLISKSDPLDSKKIAALIPKLRVFTDPKELVTETFLKESMANDLKANLLSLREELAQSSDPSSQKLTEQTDKLLTQIDYHQLISHLDSSNSIYFPFVWDQLQEGSLAFKKRADTKFYCEINLKLKVYGELNLMMGLYEGNQLEIQAHTEKKELKKLIRENIGELRSLLIDAGLTPRSIRVFESNEAKTPLNDAYAASEGSNMGFEVKV